MAGIYCACFAAAASARHSSSVLSQHSRSPSTCKTRNYCSPRGGVPRETPWTMSHGAQEEANQVPLVQIFTTLAHARTY
ncbi:hypothetical protein PF001_g22377 [Phytophthora fragariae]|uniref:Uncharacterized protein n=1 Tax=Phytophthora fragariae TaxID=53985 RepID=A0A6A4C430_9STRA|nr:hypothetical protein PF001_g22377 [Phytophthora fragariae]